MVGGKQKGKKDMLWMDKRMSLVVCCDRLKICRYNMLLVQYMDGVRVLKIGIRRILKKKRKVLSSAAQFSHDLCRQ